MMMNATKTIQTLIDTANASANSIDRYNVACRLPELVKDTLPHSWRNYYMRITSDDDIMTQLCLNGNYITIPHTDLMTINQAGAYLNTDPKRLYNIRKNYADEMEAMGMRTMNYKELLIDDVRCSTDRGKATLTWSDGNEITLPAAEFIVFPPRAVFMAAMIIKNSDVAERLRMIAAKKIVELDKERLKEYNGIDSNGNDIHADNTAIDTQNISGASVSASEDDYNGDMKLFTHPDFGDLRVTVIDDTMWFVGKDVADMLGYSNTRKALTDHVDDEDKNNGVTIRDSIGRKQKPVLINESGLYSLILSSKLTTAKQFKHWVTSEVLPSIRKNGAYINGQHKPDHIYTQTECDELMKEVGQAIVNGDIKGLSLASTKLMAAKNQHIEALRISNAMLANGILKWEDRQRINYAIRKFSGTVQIPIASAYSWLYKQLKSKYHIDVKRRGDAPYIQHIKKDEWECVIKSFSAMCAYARINPSSMFFDLQIDIPDDIDVSAMKQIAALELNSGKAKEANVI